MIIWRAAPVFCSSCRRFGGSDWGTDGRSVEVPVGKGRGGKREGIARRAGGGCRGRPLCPRRRAPPRATIRSGEKRQEARRSGRKRERAGNGPSERKRRRERGERALSLSSSAIGTERIAETRKTSLTKNALLPGSLDRFALSPREAKLAPFSSLFGGE